VAVPCDIRMLKGFTSVCAHLSVSDEWHLAWPADLFIVERVHTWLPSCSTVKRASKFFLQFLHKLPEISMHNFMHLFSVSCTESRPLNFWPIFQNRLGNLTQNFARSLWCCWRPYCSLVFHLRLVLKYTALKQCNSYCTLIGSQSKIVQIPVEKEAFENWSADNVQ